MKVFIFALFVALAHGEWTCDECKSLITFQANHATSKEGLARQARILADTLCPEEADPAACDAGMMENWPNVGYVLWSAVFYADNLCSDLCMENPLRDVTCDECKQGLMALADALKSEEAMEQMISWMQGGKFCGKAPEEEQEACREGIASWLPRCVPVLVDYNLENGDMDAECNNGIAEGTC